MTESDPPKAAAVTPAQAATYLLYRHEADDWRGATVLAWWITEDGRIAPITADGLNDGDAWECEQHAAVLMPDGSVHVYVDRVFPDLDAWRESFKPKP